MLVIPGIYISEKNSTLQNTSNMLQIATANIDHYSYLLIAKVKYLVYQT